MAETLNGIRKWAATVAAGLALSLVIGGFNLATSVSNLHARHQATMVLAQSTDIREQALEKSVAGVDAKLEGLRRDIDKVQSSLEMNSKQAAEDRALILQELGRLQGKTDLSRPNR